MFYVFPHCKKYEAEISKIKNLNRLFAYPVKPHFENKGKIILDSGAFGLNGKNMSLSYMRQLSAYYERHSTSENVLCIAPDVFGNPRQSMYQYLKWRRAGLYSNVAPVLQMSQKGFLNVSELEQQFDFYMQFHPQNMAWSNHITGNEAKNITHFKAFLKKVKKEINWLHNLGAGWSIEDIKNWKELGCFDSLDSIAYYSTRDINAFGSLNPLTNINRIMELGWDDCV